MPLRSPMFSVFRFGGSGGASRKGGSWRRAGRGARALATAGMPSRKRATSPSASSRKVPPALRPPSGCLGVVVPGHGAVATTLIGGTALVVKGLGKPIGSLTQVGKIQLSKRTEKRNPLIQDLVPLQDIAGLAFCGWDIRDHDRYEAARAAGAIEPSLVAEVEPDLRAARPMPAVFDGRFSINILGNRDGRRLRRARVVQDEGRMQARGTGRDSPVRSVSGPLQRVRPHGPNQSLPSAGRQQGGLGQHRPDRLLFYFKSPMVAPNLYPEHDKFIQLMKLKNTLRWMAGEQMITHLGLEYYD